MKLWDELDPPKPAKESELTKNEALNINKCDENFDKWSQKYPYLSSRIRLVVICLSHKMFSFPFTHFFGYKHFTVRT
jgi:hypothetical protein